MGGGERADEFNQRFNRFDQFTARVTVTELFMLVLLPFSKSPCLWQKKKEESNSG